MARDLEKSDSLSKACGITILACWILLWNPGNPVCGSHHAGSQPAETTLPEAIESACIFHLTKLPPLTYPLIIEELRLEDNPLGRFRFPHIADPVPAVGIAQRTLACPLA